MCRALDAGVELVFAWGGDGLVQRCVDVLAGTGTTLAIIPAGNGEPPRLQPRDPQVPYELDGGDRTRVKSLRIEMEPGAIEVCVPSAADGSSAG